MQRYALKAVSKYTPAIRLRFDEALAVELGAAYAAIDTAIDAELAQDARLAKWSGSGLKQKAFVLAAFRKVLNDLLGAIENLRAGYLDLSQGVLRSALEGFATAILIDKDKQVFTAYHQGRFSVNTAVDKFAHRKNLVSKSDGEQFLRVYKRLHKMTHPTVVALAVQSHPEGGNFPIGGAFYIQRIQVYRAVISEIRNLAENIAGYLATQYGR